MGQHVDRAYRIGKRTPPERRGDAPANLSDRQALHADGRTLNAGTPAETRNLFRLRAAMSTHSAKTAACAKERL
jgi:hypothetical protein